MATNGIRRVRRAVRLDERLVAAIAVAGGVAAAFSDVDPTGDRIVGRILVGVAVAVVSWAAASAPWWAVAGATGIAAVAVVDATLTIIGAAGFVVALWVGVRRRDLAVVRAACAALALNLLARSELESFHGASAVIAIATGCLLFVLGVRRRKRQTRKIAWGIVGGAAVLAVLAVIGFGLGAVRARAMLTDGERLARDGIAQLGRGEFEEAASSFATAGDVFSRASNELDRPWARPSQLVPVVAQNASAVSDLADVAGRTSSQLGEALAEIDPEQLRLVDGGFDLAAIDAVTAPLAAVQASIDELDATINGTESPWLVAPVRDRLGTLSEDIDDNAVRLDNAVTTAQLAGQMLGGDGTRRYLIMFTTPAEARGEGGFMGNFAELEAVDGRLTVTRFGRTTELNLGGTDPTARRITGPEDWLAQWGRYGFVEPGTGTTSSVPWSNITMSPDFPATAQVVAELYPQSGGRPLDGVFAMDPYVLSVLLGFTGPITIEATDQELNADNVVEFLLKTQYETATPERVDLLADVSEVTVERLLAGGLPGPVELANGLGPMVEQGRLVGWSANDYEQALFTQIGLAAGLPELNTGDGLALVINNAAANKIDVYLERTVSYDVTFDPATGQVTGTATIVLTNTAPAGGLPDVVIGNALDLPPGTNRSLVSIYTGLPVVGATRDGEPVTFEPGTDGEWSTVRLQVTIPPGGSTTLTFDVSGQMATGAEYSIATREQPMVIPEESTIAVNGSVVNGS